MGVELVQKVVCKGRRRQILNGLCEDRNHGKTIHLKGCPCIDFFICEAGAIHAQFLA